ncbi:MAG: hypothetical protein WA231_21685 [Methylocella sp.]
MEHRIGLHDLQFARIPVELRSSAGFSDTVMERVGVPKIDPSVLDASFYLYDTEEDAEAGIDPQGTGFIISYPSRMGGADHHVYGVTNWHVAVREDKDEGIIPSPVIRLNMRGSNTTDVKPFRPNDWYFVPDGPDIAVIPLELDKEIQKFSIIQPYLFAGINEIGAGNVAVGDDVFMIGLFADHDGVTTNVPSARFGNISVLPSSFAKIKQETGYDGESYVVDMHSRTGFSGSPVFMYRTLGQDLSKPLERQVEIDMDPIRRNLEFNAAMASMGQLQPRPDPPPKIVAKTLFKLLGIHVGQFPEEWEAGSSRAVLAESRRRNKLTVGDSYVRGWSGMTIVIPAWEIRRVLEEIPELVQMRNEKDEKRGREGRKRPAPEKADRPKRDVNPDHLEDFNRLVDVAARKRPRDDQS